MTAILRTALLAALVAASIPAVATGKDTSTASLLRRIELLEDANTDLERRVRELESLIKGDPSHTKSEPSKDRPIRPSTGWKDLANWRQLRLGMTQEEVRALLGEPERVDAGPVTYWRWDEANRNFANVYFMSDELAGWSEPRH